MIYLKKTGGSRTTGFIATYLTVTVISLLLCLSAISICLAGEAHVDEEIIYLKKLSIEDLLKLEVTSVSKKREMLSEAAAAVFVITQEDIRRSGATSIPEALRMVPGLQVARIDANKWAITSRGFNGRFANKLLVLIDGRSVYTPLYSGVFWNVQDTFIEDVERIEVIRGPGAALWGANAVNGVINVITRQAKDTLGGLVSAGIGTEERGFGSIRYGGRLGQDAFYRVYWKWFDRDHGVNASGHDAADDWEVFRGGFRIDWQTSNSDSLTFQGDIYEGDAGQTIDFYSLTPPYTNTVDEDVKIGGGNILARWSHAFSESSNLVLQTYYDSTQHHEVIGRLFHDIFDIEMQHRARLNDRHDITWGVGYRFLHDHIKGDFDTSMDPESRNHNLFGAFVQDEITLVKDFLRLTVGSKFEHNEFTGYEIQPGIRLAWTPDKGNTVWASVSHAVRTPSRGEHDGRIVSRVLPPGDPENPGPLPMEISLIGNHDFDSEELTAFELGYRLQPTDRLSWDIALFFNDYNSVFSIFYGDPTYETSPFPPHLLVPFSPENEISGEIYGIEVVSEWQALDWWRIETWYSYLNIQLRSHGLNEDVYAEIIEGGSPRHQISLRSSMDLPWHVEFDLWIRYTDNLTEQDVGSYVGLDARLCWKPREDIEFSLVGQNLFDDHHPEFVPEFVDTYSTEVEHSLYGKIKWRF